MAGARGASALYISYDGMTDPLGRSQVLPYLCGLSRRGHRLTVLSCEKPDRFARDGDRINAICAGAGIAWLPLRYHKRPQLLSTMLDVIQLRRAALRLHRTERFDVVHCRSYIAAMVGLYLRRRLGVPFLFDMRGFWPDERVEGGSWDLERRLYRSVYGYFKRLESSFLSEADHLISLTEAGRAQLLTRPELRDEAERITVVPCCVDLSHFPLSDAAKRSEGRSALQIEAEASVAAYLGSLGTWYMLDEMLDFFRVYAQRRPEAHLLFVTPDPEEPIRAAARARGIAETRLTIRAASRDEVPMLMAAADLGFFFIKPVFSKIASSPTKMGEMIALGLPLVANAGVGDVERIVHETGCGVAVSGFDEATYGRALDALESLEHEPAAVRERAHPWFDLDIGIERYDRVYRRLVKLGRD